MEILIRFVWFHAGRTLPFYCLVCTCITCEETACVILLLIFCLTNEMVICFATWSDLSRKPTFVYFNETITCSTSHFWTLYFEHVRSIFAIGCIMLILSSKANVKRVQIILLILTCEGLCFFECSLLLGLSLSSYMLLLYQLLVGSTDRLFQRCCFILFNLLITFINVLI